MKTACVLTVVFCFAYLVIAEVNEQCNSTEDCGEGECCVRIFNFMTPKCKKLRQTEEWCFPNVDLNSTVDVYKYMCPCAEGLSCEAEEVTQSEDGVIIYKNSKCMP